MSKSKFETQYSDCDVRFFWKGRVALYALLKSIGVQQGDEVIVQAFTCVAVPNVILYLGATPIYVDIDSKTYCADGNTVVNAISKKTKAILLQNTFGHPPDYENVMKAAGKLEIPVIADCAHGMGAEYKSQQEGQIADASIFSFQWTKPLTAGLGGVSLVKNRDMFSKLDDVCKSLQTPSVSDELLLRSQYFIHSRVLTQSNYWMFVRLYRLLRDLGLPVSSSTKSELLVGDIPDDYFKNSCKFQRAIVERKTSKLRFILDKRLETAEYYDEYLKKNGRQCAYRSHEVKHSFLRYPVKVSDSSKSFDVAMGNSIQIGEWFREPVDPSGGQWDKLRYKIGSCPVAEEICQRTINLPTDTALTYDELDKVLN